MPDSSRRGARVVILVVLVGVLLWIFGRPASESASDAGATTDASSRPGLRAGLGPSAEEGEGEGEGDAALSPSSRLSGHVVDVEDAPVPKAQVCVALPELSTELGWLPRCVTADETGYFSIGPIEPGRHRLLASARGFILPPQAKSETPMGSWAKVGAGETRDGLVLRLRPGGAEVRGTVRDIMGGTVPDALVWSESAMAHSDDEGRFSLWLDARSFVRIEVRAEGYARAGLLEHRPAGRELEVLLRPEIILAGRVIAAESGAPVADVPVVASAPRMLSYGGSFADQPQARTDEDGRFRLTGLGPGRYKPLVRADTWHGQAAQSVLLTLGETPEPIELKVYPARRVEGRLLRRESRSSCSDGRVAVYDAAGAVVDRAQADAAGKLKVGGLLPGAYDLEFTCSDDDAALPPIAVDLSDEDHLDGLWEAEELSGQTIRGRLVDADGRGVAMAFVQAELREPADPEEPRAGTAPSAVTDEDGAFQLKHLPAGLYVFFRIQAEGMAPPIEDPEVTLSRASDVDDLEIRLPRAGILQIRVQDPNGMPVPSASLKVSRVGGGGKNLKSMPHGVWTLDPTTPGTYQVKLHRPGVGGRAGPSDPSNDDLGEAIEVVAGRTATLTLVSERRDQNIHGVVQTRDGDPIADASVWAAGSETYVDWGGRTRHPQAATSVSDIDGEFTLKGLRDGVYTVHARNGVGVEASVADVASGSEGITLALAEGGTLAGQVVVRSGPAPTRFSITVNPADGSRARKENFLHTRGSWRIADLPPGEVTVEVQCAEGTASRAVTIPEGGEQNTIKLEVAARGGVRGRVVDAVTGAPIPGIMTTVKSANGRAGASTLDPGRKRYSAEDGSFELSQVPSGEVLLHLWPTGGRGQYTHHEVRVTVRPGALTDAGVLQVPRRVNPAPTESTESDDSSKSADPSDSSDSSDPISTTAE